MHQTAPLRRSSPLSSLLPHTSLLFPPHPAPSSPLFPQRLGSGFASTVYEARDTTSNFKIALKAYKKENLTELMKRQLQREIEIQAGLEHKNVLQLVSRSTKR